MSISEADRKLEYLTIRQKYVRALLTLVAGTLAIFLLASLVFAFQEISTATRRAQRAEIVRASDAVRTKLEDFAVRLVEFGELPLEDPIFGANARRDEMYRLLTLEPFVHDIWWFANNGMQTQRVTRTRVDQSGKTPEAWIDQSGFSKRGELGSTGVSHLFQIAEGTVFALLRVTPKASETGHAVVAINLAFLTKTLQSMQPSSNVISLTDGVGVLQAREEGGLRIVALAGDSAVMAANADAAGADEKTIARGTTGTWVAQSAIRIGKLPWTLIAEAPVAVTYAPLLRFAIFGFGLLIAGTLFSLFAARWLGRTLAEPIAALKAGAGNLAMGDLSARMQIKSTDELGDLAQSLNQMADQLQSYTTSLEQKVSEKTFELERANRHKSEFLANMSHELRTPLNAVIGFSDALKEQYFGALNDKQKEYVKDINDSGQHLLSLINDILDLSKIEAGKMDLELSTFHLPTAIENALVLVRERALRRQLQLSAEIAPDVGDAVGDERKFKQILINLLTNAVKFSYPNGWVKVMVARGTNETVITVQDTGPGIAPEEHAAIFEEFHQVKTSGSAKQEGTGLGLSLARRFTELHGGRIWLESELGKGAAFSFTLPDRVLGEDHVAAI